MYSKVLYCSVVIIISEFELPMMTAFLWKIYFAGKKELDRKKDQRAGKKRMNSFRCTKLFFSLVKICQKFTNKSPGDTASNHHNMSNHHTRQMVYVKLPINVHKRMWR